MTNAKVRARAKARAASNAAKPAVVRGDISEGKVQSGQIDAKSNSMRNIGSGANIKSTAAMRRGAARSR